MTLTPQRNETTWLRGKILVPAESSLMGMLETADGKILYFQENYLRDNPRHRMITLTNVKVGDEVVFKAKKLGSSVWRPIEFYLA